MTSGGVCRQSHHGVERREAFLLIPGVGSDHVGVAADIGEGTLNQNAPKMQHNTTLKDNFIFN